MKRIIVSILAILYIGTSAGANVRLHFCMDQLISWQLGQETTDNCERCGMKKTASQEDGCCKDEQQFLKCSTDQKANSFALQLTPLSWAAIPSVHIGWLANRYRSISQSATLQQTGAFAVGLPLYLRNAVFRI